MEKVIIDTDIGDDIDDAIAIALAIKSKRLDVLGVTTVFKDVKKRSKIALELLSSLKADHIPVATGLCGPILGKYSEINIPCQYMDYMNNKMYDVDNNAIDYMRKMINLYPNEITLVAIGPLTNIAALIIQEPSIVYKIKKLVIMGGAYFFHYSEWNIYQDVHAARVVFDSGINMEVIGLDVTLKCNIAVNEFTSNFKNSGLDFLISLIHSWNAISDLNGRMILHDPLVIASLLSHNILEYVDRSVYIETNGEFTTGMTYVQETAFGWEKYKKRHKVKIARDIDVEGFWKILMETLG